MVRVLTCRMSRAGGEVPRSLGKWRLEVTSEKGQCRLRQLCWQNAITKVMSCDDLVIFAAPCASQSRKLRHCASCRGHHGEQIHHALKTM